MNRINKLIEDNCIDKSWLYYFQSIINKSKNTVDERVITEYINSNDFRYSYFSLNCKNIRVIIIGEINKEISNCLDKGILFPKLTNSKCVIFWRYMLQLFYNTGSIVWLVGNVKYKGTNNEEEDETNKKDEPYTNFYNSIKEITKSTYIYKINPKIRINVTKKEDGSEYGGITDEKQIICNHYLKQLYQKEIEW